MENINTIYLKTEEKNEVEIISNIQVMLMQSNDTRTYIYQFDRIFQIYRITYFLFTYNYQLHAVSHTEHGRQREPSVKTILSPLSVEFWRHCVLSGKTQRRALPRDQSEEMEI